MPDDEERLIRHLQVFAGRARTKITVFFDGAPPGEARTARFGPVTAQFVHRSSTADHAIAAFLHKLGKRARNWHVVSTDHQVQAAARAHGARVVPARDFAAQLTTPASPSTAPAFEKPDDHLTNEELAEWLAIFKRKPD